METATKNKKNKAPAVIMMAPGELRASKTNARTHSTTQINMLARSMAEFGFMGTVLITDDNTIIAGHGRVAAALQLGIDAVPCIKHDHLSPEQIRAYVLADNKLAEAAGWDMGLLKQETVELHELGIDLSLIGFNDDDFLTFIKTGATPLTAIAEPPQRCWVVISAPLLQYGEIQHLVEEIAAIKNMHVETVVTNT
jgi:ParB-like chromosome segregation protein Spo0J